MPNTCSSIANMKENAQTPGFEPAATQLIPAPLDHTRRVPFQRNLPLFSCAVQQIQIDEILIGNVCFERKLLEIPDHSRLQSDRHRFLESLDIGVRRCGREVIFFSHGFSPSRVVVL